MGKDKVKGEREKKCSLLFHKKITFLYLDISGSASTTTQCLGFA